MYLLGVASTPGLFLVEIENKVLFLNFSRFNGKLNRWTH